jgi:DNA-binding transcriptional LysR family regulator
VLDSIVSQQCDLGITVLPVDTKLVAITRLLRCDCVCILPKGHPLEGRTILQPTDLAGEKFVSFGADSLFRLQVDEIFRNASVERILKMEARTTEAVAGMVAAGLGVSIIAPYFQEHVPVSNIVVRPFHSAIALDLAIVAPRHKAISRIAGQFRATALEYAGELRRKAKSSAMKQVAVRRPRT